MVEPRSMGRYLTDENELAWIDGWLFEWKRDQR